MNEMIIRVFPTRTKMSPDDEMAFFGPPPLWDLPKVPVLVSVTFTWDIEKGRYLEAQWNQAGFKVQIGGPAFMTKRFCQIEACRFIPGRFLKKGITITSRGCPKRCPWCLVPQKEGKLKELWIYNGHIIQDNNLLACSRGHIEKVFEMLSRQKKAAQFKGGLDIDYLQPWHVELMKQIRIGELWVACDRPQDLKRLDKAQNLLSDFSLDKKHCYVLVGYNGENQQQAQLRCEEVLKKGFLPYVQLYRGPNADRSRGSWRNFCWFWSKPRYYKKKLAHLINY